MKDGLTGSHSAIFDNLDGNIKSTLVTGYGSQLSSCFDEDKKYVTLDRLKNSTIWDESQEIAKNIMEIL